MTSRDDESDAQSRLKARKFVDSLRELVNVDAIAEQANGRGDCRIQTVVRKHSVNDLQRLRASFRLCLQLSEQVAMHGGFPMVPGHHSAAQVHYGSPERTKQAFQDFFSQAVATVSIVGDLPRARYGRTFGADIAAYQSWANAILGPSHAVALEIQAWSEFFRYVIAISVSLSGPQTLSQEVVDDLPPSPLAEAAAWSEQWGDRACIGEMYNSVCIVVDQLQILFRSPFMTLVDKTK